MVVGMWVRSIWLMHAYDTFLEIQENDKNIVEFWQLGVGFFASLQSLCSLFPPVMAASTLHCRGGFKLVLQSIQV